MISREQVDKAIPRTGFVRDYLDYFGRLTDAPAAYHLGSALAIQSTVVDKDVSLSFGGELHAHLWTMLVGESSASRKTTAIKFGQRLLEEVDNGRIGDMPGSIEGLSESIVKIPQQIIIITEFGNFLASTERGYLGPLREKLTDLYDATKQTRRLAKAKTFTATQPRVSMLVGTTPEYLEAHTKHADWTGGFFARFLTLHATLRPEDMKPVPPREERDTGARDRLTARLNAVIAAPPGQGELDPRARELWIDWFNGLMDRYGDQWIHRWAKGAAHRTPGIALKTAMLFAVDRGDVDPVDGVWKLSPAALESGINVAELHLQSVIEVVDALAPTRYGQERRMFLEAVGANEEVTTGDVIRRLQLPQRAANELVQSLLVERTLERVPASMTGGVPRYRIATADGLPDNVVPLRVAAEGARAVRAAADSALEPSQRQLDPFYEDPFGVFTQTPDPLRDTSDPVRDALSEDPPDDKHDPLR